MMIIIYGKRGMARGKKQLKGESLKVESENTGIKLSKMK